MKSIRPTLGQELQWNSFAPWSQPVSRSCGWAALVSAPYSPSPHFTVRRPQSPAAGPGPPAPGLHPAPVKLSSESCSLPGEKLPAPSALDSMPGEGCGGVREVPPPLPPSIPDSCFMQYEARKGDHLPETKQKQNKTQTGRYESMGWL